MIADFKLQFDPAEIPVLAERYDYAEDGEARAAGRAARERSYYTRDEFLCVCRWKSSRTKSLAESNSEADIVRATRAAFQADDEETRMEALLVLQGVGVPTASTLLHFASPDRYPILDVRALEALGRRGQSVYSVSYWVYYLEACRDLAETHGVPIRELDKALWRWSKEHSP